MSDRTASFFDRWQVYQDVIENDYMYHRSIHAALREQLVRFRDFRVLDLGCGDASMMARTLSGLDVATYQGVDLSPEALALADTNLQTAGIPHSLHTGDFSEHLKRAPSGSTDLIVAGFALHHLSESSRSAAYADIKRVLASQGCVLIYDVFRDESESRSDFLRRSHAWREATWTTLPGAALKAIWDHVSENDFPQSHSEFVRTLLESGFDAPTLSYASPVGIHRLYAIAASD